MIVFGREWGPEPKFEFLRKYSWVILGQNWPDFCQKSILKKKHAKIGQKTKFDVWCQLTIEFPTDSPQKYTWGILGQNWSDFGRKSIKKTQNWSKKQN